MFSFRIFLSSPRKQVWQLYPVFFCSVSKHGENLKTVSFSLVFPQNVPLEMMNANLTTLPLSFEIAIKFYIMCGNVKKNLFFPKRFNFPTLFHWTREGSLTILSNVFCPNSETSHFCKSFQKIVFFEKFLWTSKSHFWQACRNHFCQTLYYVIAQSPELIRKVWIFHKTLVFWICFSGQKDVSSAKTAESISGKVLQDFCSKSENQNKKLVFQKKVTENVLLDT